MNCLFATVGGQLVHVNEVDRDTSTIPICSQDVPAPHVKLQSPVPHNMVKNGLQASLPSHTTLTSVAVVAAI